MLLTLTAYTLSATVGGQVLQGTRQSQERAASPFTGAAIAGIDFGKSKAPFEVAAAARPFLGRPITKDVVAELVAALTEAYEHSDAALYTVAIPDQDFAGGVVKVLLTEAGADEVTVKNKERFPLLSRMAGKLKSNGPLPRSFYERQLSLMRAIPGTTFDLSTKNANNDDNLSLYFVPKRKSVEGAFGIGNRGPDLLGDFVGDGRIDFNSLATDGDRLRFTAAATPNVGRFRQFGAGYQFPVGSSGLTASANFALIHTRAKAVDLQGKARVLQLAMSYPLLRSFRRSADVGVSFDAVNSDNALFGNVFSSDRVRTLRGVASYVSATSESKIQGQIILSRGFDVLGARVNPLLSDTTFLKGMAAAGYERTFAKRFIARATVLGQLSGDRLPASELFAVGGETVGRAFDTALLSGDRGIGAVAELALRPLAKGDFSKSEIYGYADGAKVGLNSRLSVPSQHYGLASAGVGVRGKWKDKVEIGVEAGRVLDRPYVGYDQKWRLSFNYRLTL